MNSKFPCVNCCVGRAKSLVFFLCSPVFFIFRAEKVIKVLCEQTRELTDDLHDFLDYV